MIYIYLIFQGQQVGWLAGEKEGVVPFTEYPLRGLRVIGTTALQCERPDTEKVGLCIATVRSLAVLSLINSEYST